MLSAVTTSTHESWYLFLKFLRTCSPFPHQTYSPTSSPTKPRRRQQLPTLLSPGSSLSRVPCAPAAFETSPTQAQAECRIPTFPQQTAWVFRCWAVVRGARSFWFLWSLLSLFAPIPGLNPVCQHFANFSPIIPQPGANKNCNLTG